MKRPFARSEFVGVSRPQIEPGPAVVQQESGPGRGDPTPKAGEVRLDQRDARPGAVHHAHERSVSRKWRFGRPRGGRGAAY